MFATMERHGDYWWVYADGLLRVKDESYQVASYLVEAINDPHAAIGTEAREVADAILRRPHLSA